MIAAARKHVLRGRRVSSPQVLVTIIGMTVILGIALIVVSFMNISETKEQDLYFEFGKSGLQAIVVGAIGAVVTLTMREFDRQREAKLRRKEYRLELLRRLRRIFGDAKRVRRQLRIARIPTIAAAIDLLCIGGDAASRYEACMAVLIDLHLEMEAIKEELEALLGIKESTNVVKINVISLERYLDTLVDEYEQVTQRRCGTPWTSGPDALAQFVDKSRDSEFRHSFARPHNGAVNALLVGILERSPTADESASSSSAPPTSALPFP